MSFPSVKRGKIDFGFSPMGAESNEKAHSLRVCLSKQKQVAFSPDLLPIKINRGRSELP